MVTAADKRRLWRIGPIIIISIGVAVSFVADIAFGKSVARNMWQFSADLLVILPLTFILISLFEVWVKKETVSHYLGTNAKFRGHLLAIALGGTVVGPAIVALPVAYTLAKKGADLGVVFTFIGAAGVCRIPMTLFEGSCLGWRFTLIRYAVSIPLVLAMGGFLGAVLTRKGYRLKNGHTLEGGKSN